jgi:hypothetical protein
MPATQRYQDDRFDARNNQVSVSPDENLESLAARGMAAMTLR